MIKFGTGGFRAIIGDEFTKNNIQQLARAVARMMKDENVEKKTVVIGYDRRFLSKESMIWISEVLAYEGIKVMMINRSMPTPLMMFEVKKQGLDYGMAVTASHNPAIYNGVKLFTKGGKDADEVVTKNVENYIEKLENDFANKYEID